MGNAEHDVRLATPLWRTFRPEGVPFCTTAPNDIHFVTNTHLQDQAAKPWTAWPWRWRHCNPSKHPDVFRNTWNTNMQSNASKKTDNLIHWMDLCLKQRKSRSTVTTNTDTHALFACYGSGCRQRVAACGDDRGTQTIHMSARIGYPPLPIMSVGHYSPQRSPHIQLCHTSQVPLLCSHSDIYIKQTR